MKINHKKSLLTYSTFDLFSYETFLECVTEHARLSWQKIESVPQAERESGCVSVPFIIIKYIHIWWRPRKESKTRRIWKYYANWFRNLVIKNVLTAINEAQLTSTWQSVHSSVPLVLVCCKYSLLIRSP